MIIEKKKSTGEFEWYDWHVDNGILYKKGSICAFVFFVVWYNYVNFKQTSYFASEGVSWPYNVPKNEGVSDFTKLLIHHLGKTVFECLNVF